MAEIHSNAVRDTLRQILSYLLQLSQGYFFILLRFRSKPNADDQQSEDDDEFEQPSIVCLEALLEMRLIAIRMTCKSF